MTKVLRWDIFCTVIDNFGDVGVSWRLARQLVREHRQMVRLWIDDLDCFKLMAPAVNPELPCQVIQEVQICRWSGNQNDADAFAAVEPAQVIIEAFACTLPENYVISLSRMARQPVWIDLEYLSAESWVAHYHALPSPHPRSALIKTCYFPGFVAGTGGLLREKDLQGKRLAFDQRVELDFLRHQGIFERKPNQIRISLFCYESAPIESLIEVLSHSAYPVLLIVPSGRVAEKIAFLLGSVCDGERFVVESGTLTIQIIPFLEQDNYDRLLWSCDINFARGEDSFARAQWAGKPFIWNIYPQSDGAHWNKLEAFLDLYVESMPVSTAKTVIELWRAWNGGIPLDSATWVNFLDLQKSLAQHNESWIAQLLQRQDLTSGLVQFVENQL